MATAARGNTTGSTPATAARGFSKGVSAGTGRTSANLETRYLGQAASLSSPLLPTPPLFVPQDGSAQGGPDLDFSGSLPLQTQLFEALSLGPGRAEAVCVWGAGGGGQWRVREDW